RSRVVSATPLSVSWAVQLTVTGIAVPDIPSPGRRLIAGAPTIGLVVSTRTGTVLPGPLPSAFVATTVMTYRPSARPWNVQLVAAAGWGVHVAPPGTADSAYAVIGAPLSAGPVHVTVTSGPVASAVTLTAASGTG